MISPKLFFFICVFLSTLSSQVKKITVAEYNTNDGLSQSVVHSVIQDSRGFIWAGTQDGLNRFDGKEFKIYKHIPLDSNSLSNSYIWEIIEDSNGNLWIGTYGGGLNYFDYRNEIFISYTFQESKNSINGNDVRAIYEDDDGNIWVGTDNGLNRFDTQSKTWKDFSSGNNSVVPFKNIRSIYPHSEKEFWLASYGSGLIYFNVDNNSCRLYDHNNGDNTTLSNNDVWEIFKDNQDYCWVLTFGGGLQRFKGSEYSPFDKITFQKIFPSQIPDDLTAGIQLSTNEILIGSDTDGIVIINTAGDSLHFSTSIESEQRGITNNGVWDFVEDGSGGIWLGTYGGGLNYIKYSTKSFQHISTESKPIKLNNPIVFAIDELDENKYLIATYGGGLNILNYETETENYFTTENSKIAFNYLTDIVKENDSSYWIGTDGKGLSNFNPLENSFKNYNTENLELLPNNFVKCILLDSYNNIWVGTLQGFCNIQDSNKVTPGNYQRKVFPHDTRSLLELKPGVILIGTHGNGIFEYNLRSGTFEQIDNELLNAEQISQLLYDDETDMLWVGTKGRGLFQYNYESGIAKQFTETEGLCNNTILGIVQDNLKRLWITTNNGLSTYDIKKSKFTNYYSSDGLLTNEFVQGAIYRNTKGKIFAGNVKGIEIINPNEFTISNYSPPVELTKLTILNEDLPLSMISNSQIELGYKENFIRIEFASLDFSNPEKNLYRYKITPNTEDWIYLENENRVNFANLPPNEYSIELNGSNSDGVWSDKIERLSLIINPPFYNTFWFYTLVMVTIGFIVYRFYYLGIQKRIEMDQLRLKIAKDLHDDVGSSLSQISLNADMINYENEIDKIREKGELIRNKSSEMINKMNDVIWSIDSRKDRLESLVERIKANAISYSSVKDISVRFSTHLTNPNKKLDVSLRQNIFLIAKEAVNNAIKYSNCDSIKINFNETNGLLILIISDNGTGICDKKSTGNGLQNMKLRANEINGKINFISQNGLTIELTVDLK